MTIHGMPVGAAHLYRRIGKRLFDLVLTVPVIVVLSPLFALVALLVRLDSPGRALFTQERMGRYGACFRLYKFRTMTDRPRVPDHEIIGRDPEVTRIGYWLRRYKVDEFPQLWNVVKGDMSLVGPRPDLPVELPNYDQYGRKRLMVRPGLAGLSQVRGGIFLSWPERWRYDAMYVDQVSLKLDVSILMQTPAVVLLGEGKFLQQPDHPPIAERMSPE